LSADLFPETLVHPGLSRLAGFARPVEAQLIEAVRDVAMAAPLRTMATAGGKKMSVATTSCGAVGWITDRRGYRYAALDPESGRAWPAMPEHFRNLAQAAAAAAGFGAFAPDSCLVNQYVPGAKMTLHQDVDERDFSAPIVSVSLGLPAVFLWGGARRADKPIRVLVESGDVLVWGGAARKNFHGVLPLKPGPPGDVRINLTFRKVF
jgi:alkylated DNA repair protein (DNA oxidative demethylase)